MRATPPGGYRPRVPRTSLIDRARAVQPTTVDLVLTIGLTVVSVGSLFGEAVTTDEPFRDTDALAVALGLAICIPVFWRRRQPLRALVVSSTAITLLGGLDYMTNNLPVPVLFLTYAVGAYATRRDGIIGLLVVNAAIVTIYLSDPPDLDLTGTLLNVAIFSGAWLAGQVVRARTEAAAARVAEAEGRAEAQREQGARAVAEERLRLAQELHDVVAHSMSVIAVQAGMGAHVIDQRPDEAKAALEAISHTSRQTLSEMRRLLGVLRDEDGERSNAPAPGIADLPRLVADVRTAGLPVDLAVEGEASTVPHGVELSVYRLVQEGLTNVLKHAGPASAAVTVRCSPDEVSVEVADDGRGAAAAPNANGNGDPGHGLRGMQERVALWGGTFSAGPRPGGGFRVLAHLPYGQAT
jgi:signal transduction histidine kinase